MRNIRVTIHDSIIGRNLTEEEKRRWLEMMAPSEADEDIAVEVQHSNDGVLWVPR